MSDEKRVFGRANRGARFLPISELYQSLARGSWVARARKCSKRTRLCGGRTIRIDHAVCQQCIRVRLGVAKRL